MRFAILVVLGLALVSSARAASTVVFATTTDFGGPGCASWVGLDPPRTAHECVEPLSSDPVVRFELGRYYVVNRFGADNVQVIASDFTTVRQFSVGNGRNPQDIAVVAPEKAYVSLLNADYLLVVNPETGALRDSIPLAAFADADGIPEATKMAVRGGRLFLALQRLAAFAPTVFSSVVVIDLATDAVIDADPVAPGTQAIRLAGRNPVTDFAIDPANGHLLLGCAGAYNVEDDGGVEAIDPVSLVSLGFEATEATLGGEVNDIAVGAGGERFAVRSGFEFDDPMSLVRYSPASGAVTQALFSTGGFSLGDIEVNDRGELWLCDRTFASPGLRAYDVGTGTLVAGPIDVGLPPFDLVFDTGSIVSAPLPSGHGLRLLGVGPNPSRGAVSIRFAAASAAPVRVRIFDARGRAIADVRFNAVAGANAWTWAPSGATAGVYPFRIEGGRESVTGKIVLVGSPSP